MIPKDRGRCPELVGPVVWGIFGARGTQRAWNTFDDVCIRQQAVWRWLHPAGREMEARVSGILPNTDETHVCGLSSGFPFSLVF